MAQFVDCSVCCNLFKMGHQPLDTLGPIWQRIGKTCLLMPKQTHVWPSTKDTYSLRKKCEGLVIGGLDKNLGELTFACPSLYQKMLKKQFTTENGYNKIFVKKLSRQEKKDNDGQLHEHIMDASRPKKRRLNK